MTYQQREEYIAPFCEVLTFEVAEAITNGTVSGTGQGEYNPGGPVIQEDDETP